MDQVSYDLYDKEKRKGIHGVQTIDMPKIFQAMNQIGEFVVIVEQ